MDLLSSSPCPKRWETVPRPASGLWTLHGTGVLLCWPARLRPCADVARLPSVLCSTPWRSYRNPCCRMTTWGKGGPLGAWEPSGIGDVLLGPVWPPCPGLPPLLTNLLCFQQMCLLAEAERSFLLVPQKGSYWDSYLNTGQRSQKGDNQVFILAGWASMACPVTQLPWAAFQSLRMAVVQDAWETKGPWTQMFCTEAVTNST